MDAPTLELDLLVGERRVGWIVGDTIGFDGFATASDAAHAAWVAHAALARRWPARLGARLPVPDVPRLTLVRTADDEWVAADGVPIARLVPPAGPDRTGVRWFAFELTAPPPGDELSARSAAYVVYLELLRSHCPWPLLRGGPAMGGPADTVWQSLPSCHTRSDALPAAGPPAGATRIRPRLPWRRLVGRWRGAARRAGARAGTGAEGAHGPRGGGR